MKKLVLLLSLSAILFTACNKDEWSGFSNEAREAKAQNAIKEHFKSQKNASFYHEYTFGEFAVINKSMTEYEALDYTADKQPTGCGMIHKTLEKHTAENCEIFLELNTIALKNLSVDAEMDDKTFYYTFYLNSNYEIIAYHSSAEGGCTITWE